MCADLHDGNSGLSRDELRDLGFALLEDSGFDEKFEGIECLVKVAKDFSAEDIHLLEPIIDKHVFDWATCDNLSGHVVTKALLGNPELFPVLPLE